GGDEEDGEAADQEVGGLAPSPAGQAAGGHVGGVDEPGDDGGGEARLEVPVGPAHLHGHDGAGDEAGGEHPETGGGEPVGRGGGRLQRREAAEGAFQVLPLQQGALRQVEDRQAEGGG